MENEQIDNSDGNSTPFDGDEEGSECLDEGTEQASNGTICKAFGV